ncbi:hypothetical protein [Acuticoccus sp.]|uniref:hypothetical protein n=1 Tax=Acuticoccus sp. TaxID=1904378 RepID=UPI003B520F05
MTPPIAINGAVGKRGRTRRTVLVGRTLRHAGDAASRRRRKRFGRCSPDRGAGRLRQGRGGSLAEVDTAFTTIAAADALRRLAGPVVTAP